MVFTSTSDVAFLSRLRYYLHPRRSPPGLPALKTRGELSELIVEIVDVIEDRERKRE